MRKIQKLEIIRQKEVYQKQYLDQWEQDVKIEKMNAIQRKKKLLEHRAEVKWLVDFWLILFRLKDFGKKNSNNSKEKRKRKYKSTNHNKPQKNISSKLYSKKKKDFSENTCPIQKIFYRKGSYKYPIQTKFLNRPVSPIVDIIDLLCGILFKCQLLIFKSFCEVLIFC